MLQSLSNAMGNRIQSRIAGFVRSAFLFVIGLLDMKISQGIAIKPLEHSFHPNLRTFMQQKGIMYRRMPA